MPAIQRVRRTIARFVFISATAIALSCGGDEKGITKPPATGNLTITVVNGIAKPAAVHVSGPSGYTHTVTETTTLSGIPAGAYTVTADSIEEPDSIVGATIFSAQVTHGSVTVNDGETAQASVAYSFAHQRGALWVANSGVPYGVESFGVEQLRSSRELVTESTASVLGPSGIAFDSVGDMWVSDHYYGTLSMYTIAERNAHGDVSNASTITSTSLITPEAIAFDASGTLWIADFSGALVGLTAAQLAAGGSGIIAAVTIHDTSSIPAMEGLAIDGAGNVWLTEPVTKQIVEYTHDQLTTSGVKVPAVRIATPTQDPVALAFDSHGNLWVGDQEGSSIMMFTPSQLTAGGAPTPTVAFGGPVVGGLAFDNSGTLWATSKFGVIGIYAYPASQLTTSGSHTATVVLDWTPTEFRSEFAGIIAFDPWAAVHPEPASTP